MTAGLAQHGIVDRPELHRSDILEPQHIPIRQRSDHEILIILSVLVASAVFQNILKRVERLRSKRSCRRLQILIRQNLVNISRNESILRHPDWIQPYTHGILRAEYIDIAHPCYSRDLRFYIDFHIVRQEAGIIGIIRAIECYRLQRAVLSLTHRHTAFGHLRRQQSLSRRHSVLDIDNGHIRIRPLPEIDSDCGCARVGSRRCHIHHILHSVERFLKRHYDAFQHRFGIRSGICGGNAHRWRRDIGKLFYWKLCKSDHTHNHYQHGYDAGKHRPIYKGFYIHRI